MLYQHDDWTVEVSEHPDFLEVPHDAVFRGAMRLGKQCQLFTLLKKDSEEALIQMQLFKGGFAHFEVYTPLLVQIDQKKKFVLIGVFDTKGWDKPRRIRVGHEKEE